MRARRSLLAAILGLGVLGATLFAHYGRSIWFPYYAALRGRRTVTEAIREVGPAATARLAAHFEVADVPYPPGAVTLLAFKREKRLEVWAARRGEPVFVRAYPVLAASGGAGPKLREGDRQVPEGIYAIEGLNPNSSFHLSLELDYPNEFDVARAAHDGRTDLGGDIFIHGKATSIGCLAIGDEAIEEIFTLAHAVGRENVRVVIAPHDPGSQGHLEPPSDGPGWIVDLYEILTDELAAYRNAEA